MKRLSVLLCLHLILSGVSLVYAQHRAVDLGLSICWNTADAGSESESQAGVCLTWQDSQEYDFYEGHSLPTMEQMAELCTLCTWVWTTYDNAAGYMVTGPSGASIFIPSPDYDDNSMQRCDGRWIAHSCEYQDDYAVKLFMDNSNHALYGYEPKSTKMPIRAVCTNADPGDGIDMARVGEEGYIVVRDNNVILRDFNPETRVSVFSQNGAVIATFNTDVNGYLCFSTDFMTAGIYMINARHITYKLLKK